MRAEDSGGEFRSAQAGIERFADHTAGAVEAGFHVRKGDAEAFGGFFAAYLFDVAQEVDLAVGLGDRGEGFFHAVADATGLEVFLEIWPFGRLLAFDELQDWGDGFALLHPAADAAADGGEPTAHGLGVADLVDRLVGGKEGLDEDVLGVIVVSADAGDLAVDGVFVLADKPVVFAFAGGIGEVDGNSLSRLPVRTVPAAFGSAQLLHSTSPKSLP